MNKRWEKNHEARIEEDYMGVHLYPVKKEQVFREIPFLFS
jgi:hypothetical protein